MMNRVINFHKVSDSDWFEKVIAFLKNHYTMISAQDIINHYYKGARLNNACLVTVDDGDRTSYEVIYPILKKHQVPAVFFVSPEKTLRNGRHLNFWFQEARHSRNGGCLMEEIHGGSYTIDGMWEMIEADWKEQAATPLQPQNMSLEQVLEIDRGGLVTIGAHTMDHPFLARESSVRSEYEIKESISQLEQILGHPILAFAYPNGRPVEDFGNREMEVLRHTTCLVAFSTQPKAFSLKNSPYAIPRFGLTCGSVPFIRAKLLLGSHYIKIKKTINILKRIKS